MKRNKTKLFLAFLFSICSIYVLTLFLGNPVEFPSEIKDYYIQHFIEETYATNSVTAIYLDYRVYDSIFETLMLLASATAVICFSRRSENE